MAVIPCDKKVDCPGTDLPLTNYSAEGPEQVPQYFSIYFPTSWDRFGCLSLCVSEISQNDADLCAIAQEAACLPPNPPPQFCSTAQTCSCESFGGSEFFYTTPAGTFCADTQEAADALSGAYACDRCGGSITSTQIVGLDACACLGDAYSSQISYLGNRPTAWIITGGSLPSGMTLNFTTGQITGTPTSTGIFSFTVQAFTSSGYATKTMSITVITVSTTALDEYTIGSPYSFQMQATGGVGPYSWRINSGSLPTGLTMSLTGLITGTPTAAGVNPMVFQVIDTECANDFDQGCSKSLSIDESSICGPLPAVSLLSYYKCDDVAFPVVDSFAGKDMTSASGDPFADVEPGIINTGFFGPAGTGARYGSINIDPQWELTGEQAFTIRAWFWYSGTSSVLYDTRIGDSTGRYALIMFRPALGAYFTFQIRGSISYTHRHSAPIGAIGWHRVIGVFRKNCGTYLKIDNNSTTFFPDPIELYPGASAFIHDIPNTIDIYPKTGIDEVGVWRGAWSEAQMLYDWNGGAGRSYPDVPI